MLVEKKFSCGISAIPPVQSPFAKIFRFAIDPNHLYIRGRPVPPEGRLMIVTAVGRDAVDAGGATDESAACGRRSRVVLTPRRRRQVGNDLPATVTKKPDHRGE